MSIQKVSIKNKQYTLLGAYCLFFYVAKLKLSVFYLINNSFKRCRVVESEVSKYFAVNFNT